MSSPSEKILALLAAQQISASEADQLLAALQPERSTLDTWLLDPFVLLRLRWAWVLSFVVVAGAVVLAQFGIRLDGTMGLYTTASAISWQDALLNQVAAWPLSALAFWAVARLANRRPSLVEMFGFVGAARLPMVVAGVVSALLTQGGIELGPDSLVPLLFQAVVMLLFGWQLVALLSAFRVSTGTRGRNLTATFFGAILCAQIVSMLFTRLFL